MTTPEKTNRPPVFGENFFTCPYSACSVVANQRWRSVRLSDGVRMPSHTNPNSVISFDFQVDNKHLMVSTCLNCGCSSVWRGKMLIYPILDTSNVPSPNKDLPSNIQKTYREAANVLSHSRRGAALLLRVAIEEICIEKKCKGKDLHEQIKFLEKNNPQLQDIVVRAMHDVRFIGNESAHAGSVEINEAPEVVMGMFKLVSFIAEILYSEPKKREDIHNLVNKVRKKAKTVKKTKKAKKK